MCYNVIVLPVVRCCCSGIHQFPDGHTPWVCSIWGFDYNVTHYNFRKTLDVCSKKYIARGGEIQGFF